MIEKYNKIGSEIIVLVGLSLDESFEINFYYEVKLVIYTEKPCLEIY